MCFHLPLIAGLLRAGRVMCFHLPLIAGLLRSGRVMCLPLIAGLLRSGRAVHEGEHGSHDRTRYLNRIFTGQ